MIVKNNCHKERPLTIPSFKFLAALATTGSVSFLSVWCITSCIEATDEVNMEVNHEVSLSEKKQKLESNAGLNLDSC